MLPLHEDQPTSLEKVQLALLYDMIDRVWILVCNTNARVCVSFGAIVPLSRLANLRWRVWCDPQTLRVFPGLQCSMALCLRAGPAIPSPHKLIIRLVVVFTSTRVQEV